MATIVVEEPADEEPVAQTQTTTAQPEPEAAVASEPAPVTEPVLAAETPVVNQQKQSRKLPVKPKFLAAGAVVLIIVIALFVLMNDRKDLQSQVDKLKNTGQVKSATDTQEAEQLKQEVGQFYAVPADEVPTVATVVDASKVKSQPFFANSENGDKVLLFSKAGKAILYRPSTKKIIEVAPINLNNTQSNTSETAPSTNSNSSTTNRR